MPKPNFNILDNILNNMEVDYEIGINKNLPTQEPPDLLKSLKNAHHQEDWRGLSQQALSSPESILSELMPKSKTASVEHREKLAKAVSDLLHLGLTPNKVMDVLGKKAELVGYSKTMLSELVGDMAGVVGFAYIEPDHWTTCQDTYNQITDKGKLSALAVKKTANCNRNCQHCVSGKFCSLYKRPIVASAEELREVVRKEASKRGKTASRADLIQLHNGDDRTQVKQIETLRSTHVPTAGMGVTKEAARKISSEQIATALKSASLPEVYESLLPEYGKQATDKAVKSFLNDYKTNPQTVDISKLDCKYLKAKLSSACGIYGTAKCKTCTYRGGQHCGLTGGTLTYYPGMIKQNITASTQEEVNPAKEFDLQTNTSVTFVSDNRLEVE